MNEWKRKKETPDYHWELGVQGGRGIYGLNLQEKKKENQRKVKENGKLARCDYNARKVTC